MTHANQRSVVSKMKKSNSENPLYLVIFVIIIVIIFLRQTGWLLIVWVIVSITIILISSQRETLIPLEVKISTEP